MTQTLQTDPIHIFYPNGGTSAVQVYVWDTGASQPVLWDGAFSGTITIGAISGDKSNNAAAPTNDNIGALVAVANAAAPSWTEGRQVLLSTDLSGAQRVTGSISVSNFPATQPVSGTITVVQPTAANLNATVTGTVAVTQVTSPWVVSGTVTTNETVPTTIFDGHKTIAVAGTAAAIAASQAIKSVTVKGLSTNTGLVYVGNSSVSSSNGFVLKANESISMDISDLATVFIDVSVNTEGISYIAVN